MKVLVFCVLLINFANVWAQDIMRMHKYVSNSESGYTSVDDEDVSREKSMKLYRILNTRGGVNLEQVEKKKEDGVNNDYMPVIKGALNKFYQKNEKPPVLFTEESLQQNNLNNNQPVLSKYVSVFYGRSFLSNINITQDGKLTNFAGHSEWYYQGIAGVYLGRVLKSFSFVRLEYGGQYEVIPFVEETDDRYNLLYNHNGTASVRMFVDMPVFPNLAFSVGGEFGIGLFQQIGQETVRSFAKSYALLSGATFALSHTKSLYVMARYRVIPSMNVKFQNNVEKAININSIGISVGMLFFI